MCFLFRLFLPDKALVRRSPRLNLFGNVVPVLGLERLRQPLEQLVLLRRELRAVDGGVDLNNSCDSLHDSLVTAYQVLPLQLTLPRRVAAAEVRHGDLHPVILLEPVNKHLVVRKVSDLFNLLDCLDQLP